MPSFEIPDGPTSVALKTEAGFHKANAVFGVTNKTGEGLTARFSVQIQGGGKAEWYSIQGEPERPVAAGETQTVTVVAKIPGADQAKFLEIAKQAETGCPVSKVLKARIGMDARLVN